MAADRGIEWDHGGGVVGWRVLAQALMWAMVIEVTHVPVEDGTCVSFVVDQQSVSALLAGTADESLGIAVRPRSPGRDLDDVDAFGGEEGWKALVDLVSRSQIRKRNELICSPKSISRLRAAWVVQTAVGWSVTPRIWIRRVCTSMTKGRRVGAA